VALRDSLGPGVAAKTRTTAPNESHPDEPHHLALVFAMIDDAAIVTDIDGRIVDCNPAARRLLACSRGKPLVRPNATSGRPGIDPARADVAQRAALHDGRWEGEIPFINADGQPGALHTVIAASRDAKGDVTGLVSIYRDITARQAAEEALLESEKRFRFALEGANEGLWDWSIDTGDVYYSAAAERMLGYEPGEMERRAGGTWDQSLHPDDLPAVQQAIDEHVAGHTPAYEAEYRCRTKQGGWKWLLGRGKVVERHEDGSPSRMTGIHIDITDRKQAEETRARLTAILDATPDLVATSDAKFTTLYMNPAGRRLLGIAEYADLAGRWIGNTYPERVRTMIFEEAIPTAIRDGYWRGESAFLGADGAEHPATQVILSHRNPSGGIEYLSTVIRDDTDRRRAAEAIRESEERHRLLFEENPIPLLVIDAETLMFLSVDAVSVNAPRPVVLFQVAKALITGTPPNVGEERSLTERELRTEAAREAR